MSTAFLNTVIAWLASAIPPVVDRAALSCAARPASPASQAARRGVGVRTEFRLECCREE